MNEAFTKAQQVYHRDTPPSPMQLTALLFRKQYTAEADNEALRAAVINAANKSTERAKATGNHLDILK